MPSCNGRLFILILTLAASAAGATPSLDELCPVEWRNVPLKQALEELSSRFNLPLLMDESVSPEVARMPVRMYTRHLTGRQALNWLARWAGLEAAFVDGSLLIAHPERLPRIWRKEIPLRAASQPAPDDAWAAIRDRSADINWIDAPLSLVTRDVSTLFGVDLICDPEILEAGGMINLQQNGTTLAQLCDAVAGQLNAAIDLIDGALWVHLPMPIPTSRPATRTATPPESKPAEILDTLLSRRVVIDSPPPDWKTFVRILTGGARVDCRLQVPPAAPGPDFTARGTAREILNAANLLGRLDYRLEPSGKENTPILLIQIRSDGR